MTPPLAVVAVTMPGISFDALRELMLPNFCMPNRLFTFTCRTER